MSRPDDFVVTEGILVEYTGTDKNIVVPEGVTYILSLGSLTADDIESISLPDSLADFSFSSFFADDADKIAEKLEDENGLIVLGSWFAALRGKQDTVTFPAQVRHIGSDAFNCRENHCSVKKVILNEGLEEIGEKAFQNSDVEEVVLPSSLKRIAARAFWDCDQLTKINVPDSVQVDPTAFLTCSGLTDECELTKNTMEIKDGVLMRYAGEDEKVVVPADVTKICDMAFYDDYCPCLREIVLEGYKTVIEDGAFSPEPIDTWTIVLPDGYFEQTEKLDAGTIIYLLKHAKSCKDYGVGLSITVTIRDYAALLLFQTDQKLLAYLEKEAGKSANNVVKVMTELLQEKGKAQHYVKAARFAAGYPKKVSKKAVKELYNAAQAANADDAVQILEDSFWDIQ